MKTSTIAVIVALLFVAGGAWYVFGYKDIVVDGGQVDDGVFCTADAMQCPDGSYVGRTGPNCQFVCPTANATSSSGGGGFAEYKSGLQGVVFVGPTCPVERNPPDPACADKPVATNVWVSRKSAPQQIVATVSSGTDGVFKVSLPPGEYIVQAGSSGVPFPRCGDISTAVGATGYTNIVVNCDSGIR